MIQFDIQIIRNKKEIYSLKTKARELENKNKCLMERISVIEMKLLKCKNHV